MTGATGIVDNIGWQATRVERVELGGEADDDGRRGVVSSRGST